jgi:hypothetical protein
MSIRQSEGIKMAKELLKQTRICYVALYLQANATFLNEQNLLILMIISKVQFFILKAKNYLYLRNIKIK